MSLTKIEEILKVAQKFDMHNASSAASKFSAIEKALNSSPVASQILALQRAVDSSSHIVQSSKNINAILNKINPQIQTFDKALKNSLQSVITPQWQDTFSSIKKMEGFFNNLSSLATQALQHDLYEKVSKEEFDKVFESFSTSEQDLINSTPYPDFRKKIHEASERLKDAFNSTALREVLVEILHTAQHEQKIESDAETQNLVKNSEAARQESERKNFYLTIFILVFSLFIWPQLEKELPETLREEGFIVFVQEIFKDVEEREKSHSSESLGGSEMGLPRESEKLGPPE